MAPTNVGYSFKEAISHFFRNWTTSLGAVITIFLSLFIIGLFIMGSAVLNSVIGTVEDQVVINAFISDDADQADANDAGQPDEESHEDEAGATQDESADEGDQQSDDTQEAAEGTQEEGEQQGAEEAPLNTLPKRELMALFEKKVGVKPSAKLTIADLVAGIEGADD